MSDERFGGLGRLVGVSALERLRRARVCVVGIGGVGTWAVEALARSGIGHLTLVDLDDVCVTNVNRQLHALENTIGRPKAEVMAERVRLINPAAQAEAVVAFFSADNADALLERGFDHVVDAIDRPAQKALLVASCRARGIGVVCSGGAAGRRDGTAVRVADLAFSSHDRLLAQVRQGLRKSHGFPAGGQAPFGVDCVFSTEPPAFPQCDGSVAAARDPQFDAHLDCEHGLGTATFVTGAFGFAAAGVVVRALIK